MKDLEKIAIDDPLPLALREELRRALSLGKMALLSGDEECRVEATKLLNQVKAKADAWRKARVATSQHENHTVGPLGVDASQLGDLPQALRGEVLAALTEQRAASQGTDMKRMEAATTRVAELHARVQEWRAAEASKRQFLTGAKKASGTHAVAKFFAARAGVKPR